MTSVKKVFSAVKEYFGRLGDREERALNEKTFYWHENEYYDYR